MFTAETPNSAQLNRLGLQETHTRKYTVRLDVELRNTKEGDLYLATNGL